MLYARKKSLREGASVAFMSMAVVLGAASDVSADAYEYIKTAGYDPEIMSMDSCSSMASSGASFETGALSLRTESTALDARVRTWRESAGKALKSTKFRPLRIILK